MSAWKTFRRLGDEPTATARHVMGRPHWPSSAPLRILDLGCGDGRMLESFLVGSRREVARAVLVDPDQTVLAEATTQLEGLGLGTEIEAVNGVADVEGIARSRIVDVGLAIHLVYLMPHRSLCKLLEGWPARVPLYIVMDSPTSVFGELWLETAPDYAARASSAHSYLALGAKSTMTVSESDFQTEVANPFMLPQPQRDLVMSLLCYCDFPSLPKRTQDSVEAIVARYATNGTITCACRCYEVLKTARSGEPV
jgi:SAM-dependent methyltransferase